MDQLSARTINWIQYSAFSQLSESVILFFLIFFDFVVFVNNVHIMKKCNFKCAICKATSNLSGHINVVEQKVQYIEYMEIFKYLKTVQFADVAS